MNLRINIRVEDAVVSRLRTIAQQMVGAGQAEVNRAMGVEVQQITVRHLGRLQGGTERAKSAAGRPHTGWFARAAGAAAVPSALEADAGGAVLTIKYPGLSRAFRDVTIRPKTARALAIPLHPQAYGKRAGELWDRLKLFIPKGTRVICANINGRVTPFYWLASSVTQKQDRSLLPSDDEFVAAGKRAVKTWVTEKLEKK